MNEHLNFVVVESMTIQGVSKRDDIIARMGRLLQNKMGFSKKSNSCSR